MVIFHKETKVCGRPTYVLYRYINPVHLPSLSQCPSIIKSLNGPIVQIGYGLAILEMLLGPSVALSLFDTSLRSLSTLSNAYQTLTCSDF